METPTKTKTIDDLYTQLWEMQAAGKKHNETMRILVVLLLVEFAAGLMLLVALLRAGLM